MDGTPKTRESRSANLGDTNLELFESGFVRGQLAHHASYFIFQLGLVPPVVQQLETLLLRGCVGSVTRKYSVS